MRNPNDPSRPALHKKNLSNKKLPSTLQPPGQGRMHAMNNNVYTSTTSSSLQTNSEKSALEPGFLVLPSGAGPSNRHLHMSVMTVATQATASTIESNAMIPFKPVRDSVATTTSLPAPTASEYRNVAVNKAVQQHQDDPAMKQLQQFGIHNVPLTGEVHDKVNQHQQKQRKKDVQKIGQIEILEDQMSQKKKRVRLLMLILIVVAIATISIVVAYLVVKEGL